jgi:archaellum component FlaC
MTITTDKAVYGANASVMASGVAAPNSAVTIQIFNPSNTLVAVAQTTTTSTGSWIDMDVLTFPASATSQFPYGEYVLKAYAAGETAETTITFSASVIPPQVTEGLNIVVNMPAVTQADVPITIFVHPMDAVTNQALSGALITGTVLEPTGLPKISFSEVMVGSYKGTITPSMSGSYIIGIDVGASGYEDTRKIVAFQSLEVSDIDLEPVNSKIAGLESKLSGLESKLSGLESKIDTLNSAISSSMGRLETSVTSSLSKLEGSMSKVSEEISSLSDEVSDLSDEVSKAATSDEVSKGFSDVEQSIAAVETSVNSKSSELAEVMKSSSTDLSVYLMAISILVVITLILSAIALLRIMRR